MIGIVFLGDLNVNLELVKRGHAWAYRQYMRKEDSALCINEAAARTAKKGLWASKERPVAPWEWRRKKTRAAPTDYSRETARTLHCGYRQLVTRREARHRKTLGDHVWAAFCRWFL